MEQFIKETILKKYNNPVSSAKDCDLLSEEIFISTNRKISSTTLRRFFGLLPSKSNLSKYNLDTLAIYCGQKDYQSYTEKKLKKTPKKNKDATIDELKIKELTNFTLSSISRKSLGNFNDTIPRVEFNNELNHFIESEYSIYPVIAPGGYGKSVALAHWIKSLDSEQNEILFCSASIFYQLISSNSNIKFQLNFNTSDPNSFFTRIHKKGFILIIDSVDELSSNIQKMEKLFNYLKELFQKFGEEFRLKLIFSVRESYWNNLLKTEVIKQLEKINKKDTLYIPESGFNNFPKLSVSEIKRLFEINNTSVQYNAIPFLIKDIISIPINLFFLFELLNKDDTLSIISSNSLNRIYLKEFVFISKFAEGKEDIIWDLIELMENNNKDYAINKNILKKMLPIHLKRETEYYNAYKELIINGILHEERLENNFGIFTTVVGFKHQNFFYYLSALHQIQKYGNLDYTLLKNICNLNKDNAWKSNVISILYEIAYENEDYKTLKDFCLLPEEILSSIAVRFSVGNSFRIKNSIRDNLIEKYASCSNGQTYFFEQFVDTNFIVNNYEESIKYYLNNKNTKEATLFGNTILFLSGFLKMDATMCMKHFKIFESIEPDHNIHPWPIGRKVAYQILYKYFVEQNPIKDLKEFIYTYQKIAYSYKNYVNLGVVEYELPIFIALFLTKEYETILLLYDKVIKSYHIYIPKELSYVNKYNQNILPFLFAEYAKYKLGLTISDNYLHILEKTIDSFPSTFDDFQYKIILKYFLSDLYKNTNSKKSKEYFDLALKLSEFAQYVFYTNFLFINNQEENNELIKKGKLKFKSAGFNH